MLSIITINYNGAEKTIKLLESLASQTDKNFHVCVIDNASQKDDFGNINSHILGLRNPNIELLKNSENLGFSGGCNIGIRRALENGSEWAILLNNDTWVENDFISRLKANLGGKTGLAGIPLVENGQTAYAGQIEWLKPTLNHIHDHVRPTRSYMYVIGGAMAIHGSVFDKIGMLDDRYFLYFEDADFSLRARKAKLPITILEEPKANHQVSASTAKLGAPLLLRYHYRNALFFNSKNGPVFIKILVWPWSIMIILKQLIKIFTNSHKQESKAILAGIFDWYKNKMGKINA